MTTGHIISRGGGLFHWNLHDFTISHEKDLCVLSPPFIISGVSYKIVILKAKESYSIRTTFWRPDGIPLPHESFEFQLRSGNKNVSPSYIVTPAERTDSLVRCAVDMERYFRERGFSVRFPLLTLSLRMNDGRHPERKCVSCAIQTEVLDLSSRDTKERKLMSCAIQTEVQDLSSCDTKGEEEEVDEDSEADKGEMNSKDRSLKKLQKDLKKLFMSPLDADVTLKVDGKEFHAHKGILRVRSPVFDAMFGHDMEEKLSGAATIEDCDNRTFPDFLNYLYTGSTDHVSEENVCQLYAASDKYEVMEFIAECREFMKSHFSVETFCDFISLALKHQDGELIDSATEFFCANVVEIVKSAKWQTFLTEYPIAGNELFLKAWQSEKMFKLS